MQYLLGLLGLIGFFFLKTKKDSAEALVENQDVNKKLNPLDQDIAKNTGLDQAEEAKRKQIEEDMKNAKADPNVLDFFNRKQ